MLISLPFLADAAIDAAIDADDDMVRYAMGGSYPVTSHLEWHNGAHLVSPTAEAPVRAIADGKVIYVVKPDTEPSQDLTHAQNYGAVDGKTKLWTDKGMLILEHETEIGANGTTPVTLKYFSVYMHLKKLEAEMAVGKKLYRKAKLGQPGQIYGQPNHMHFEICMDDDNIKTLLGHAPGDHPAAGQAPTADGRTDVVFGSSYVYLPANTPVLEAEPPTHMATLGTNPLGTDMWVQIAYVGTATLTSYFALGDKAGSQIGQRTDPDAEYKLYATANDRHDKVVRAAPTAKSSPSGWYELLRFGRNLGRGPLATDKDPLPDRAEHWRKICTPAGEKWANLNAERTFKFSDADFPSFLGWQCINDDENTTDQRCDSIKLRTLLAVSIDDMAEREKALQKTPPGRSMLAKQIKHAKVKDKLPQLICKFPSEFDQGKIDERYGHVKEEDEFKTNTDNWDKFTAHIKAITRTDLPKAYKDAQWHVHPVAFINQMRKCGWLSQAELAHTLPRYMFYTNSGSPREAITTNNGMYKLYFDEAKRRLQTHQNPLNICIRKYIGFEKKRIALFLAQVILETAQWRNLGGTRKLMHEWSFGAYNSLNPATQYYSAFYGRGIMQLTWAGNYKLYGEFCKLPNATSLYVERLSPGNPRITQTSRHYSANPSDGGVLMQWAPQYDPDIIGEDPYSACDSGGFYWVSKRFSEGLNINRVCDRPYTVENIGFINRLVNGGGNGYYERQAYSAYLLRYLTEDVSINITQEINLPSPKNKITVNFEKPES